MFPPGVRAAYGLRSSAPRARASDPRRTVPRSSARGVRFADDRRVSTCERFHVRAPVTQLRSDGGHGEAVGVWVSVLRVGVGGEGRERGRGCVSGFGGRASARGALDDEAIEVPLGEEHRSPDAYGRGKRVGRVDVVGHCHGRAPDVLRGSGEVVVGAGIDVPGVGGRGLGCGRGLACGLACGLGCGLACGLGHKDPPAVVHLTTEHIGCQRWVSDSKPYVFAKRPLACVAGHAATPGAVSADEMAGDAIPETKWSGMTPRVFSLSDQGVRVSTFVRSSADVLRRRARGEASHVFPLSACVSTSHVFPLGA